MCEIRVVHLVWAPLGTAPLQRFARSYSAHPAGLGHRLTLVFKEFDDETTLATARAAVTGLDYDEVQMPGRRLDLAAYRDVVDARPADAYFFCNSNTEIMAPRWLGALAGHLQHPGVGIVGATGSYESGLTPVAWPFKPLRAPFFGPFPNPHVRTNAFMLRRELALDLRWPRAGTKTGTWAVENGRRSITRQVLDRGQTALVVGRDGRAYPPDAWPASATFRAGEQENLLVADNRTREWAEAPPERRRLLTRLAWGRT